MSRYDDLAGSGRNRPARAGRPRGNQRMPGPAAGPRSRRPRLPRRNLLAAGRRPPAARAAGHTFLGLGSHPVVSAVAILATAVLVGASLTAYIAYRNVYDSIRHDDVTAAMLGKRPPKLSGAMNLLVVGSDSRKGTHGQYGHIGGSRSDTAMLLHISPTHQHAVVISFPRDSVVPVLGCLADGHGHAGQSAAPGQEEMLNATYSAGGAPCLWKTLEQTTGIRIDHFLEVNFSGFRSIVNDIGGINVCLPFAIKDPASGLNLTAGRQSVNGAQALAFVRERHVGLGSDLQRIQRQQYFLAAAAQKVESRNLLGDPNRVYSVIRDVARSLTTDSGLSLSAMVGVANSMKGLSSSALHFISLPVVPDPSDPNRVEWARPRATELFRAIARDSALAQPGRGSSGGSRPASPAPTVSPSQVQVDVLNGSGTAGLAGTTASGLSSRGFHVVGQGDAANFNYASTVIEYPSPSLLPAVNTLKNQLGGAQVQQVQSATPDTVSLILGSDFSGLGAGQQPAPTPGAQQPGAHQPSVKHLAKNYDGISGSTNICKDSSAFAGPDDPSMFRP